MVHSLNYKTLFLLTPTSYHHNYSTHPILYALLYMVILIFQSKCYNLNYLYIILLHRNIFLTDYNLISNSNSDIYLITNQNYTQQNVYPFKNFELSSSYLSLINLSFSELSTFLSLFFDLLLPNL